jgi:hypothetical protein
MNKESVPASPNSRPTESSSKHNDDDEEEEKKKSGCLCHRVGPTLPYNAV